MYFVQWQSAMPAVIAKLHTGTCGSKIHFVVSETHHHNPLYLFDVAVVETNGCVLASQSPLCWLMLLLHFAETNGCWQSSPFVCLLMLLHCAETNGSWHAGPKHHRVATSHDDVEILCRISLISNMQKQPRKN